MYDHYSILKEACSSTAGFLATIIKVEGSSYQKEGTSMVINHDGKRVGLLSGGCLETDLVERIKQLDTKTTSFFTIYDMRSEDDLTWGQGVGCNGSIHVLVEKLTAELKNLFNNLLAKIDQGRVVKLVREISLDASYVNYHFSIENEMDNVDNPTPKTGINLSISLDSKATSYDYTQIFQSRPNLYVFGAGPDSIPLVELAASAGFNVTVCDWREGYCNKENFPKAHRLMVGNLYEQVNKLNPKPSDFVVIMTHHFQKDYELTTYLLQKKLKYLGILGSLDRSTRLLKGFTVPEWVSFPVGLQIGAKGPYEIAISILAEIIKYKNINEVNQLVSN
ncbi:XdhC family protein [Litchfieldia alkalitelluris]|uniref:XdhC family protein n=1 Tax=Litchfieldia alkalitelluris TaxID=304268 RepID=UPI0009985BF8|nr:XdhC/CoxI family protein [Litchfieldia alkalitelluris]